MAQNFQDNTLYEMDNLVVLRGMNSETVDLIATDPPFNTKRNRSGTAGQYVDNWKWGDTDNTEILPEQWKWNEVHPQWLEEIKDEHSALYQVIESTKVVQGEDTAAFLCFLSVRLLEMHRILKPTGSIYLHCDHTANAYIRMAMDAIFGKKNLRNEIVWCYTGPGSPKMRQFNRKHDTIFWYSKDKQWTFNKEQIRLPYAQSTIARGKYDSNSPATGSGFRDTERGKVPEDWWDGFPSGGQMSKEERTGSPDQKPLALYKRIIEASSEKGEIVLDPFCGCATTIVAANELKRRWIGIDRRVDARYHIITRLMGIPRKERERLKKYATDQEWLNRETLRYEMHYQTETPKRTDKGDQTVPELPNVYVAEPENPHTHAEMKELLVNQFGAKCWGCNYIPPDDRYLHLDHINPKSAGGTNHIDNRALLCQPCNTKKSDTMSLSELYRQNERDNHIQPNPRIDLREALNWTKEQLIRASHEIMRERERQIELKFDDSQS